MMVCPEREIEVKRWTCLVAVFVMMLCLCACGGQKADVADMPTWQEQYDLGIRYLSDGNYEEAIIAFLAAIEIDPKQPDAYLKAAETYEVMGDMEAALAILQRGAEATQSQTLREQLAARTRTETDETGEREETAPSATYGNRWESAPYNADRIEMYIGGELEFALEATAWNDDGLPVRMDSAGGQGIVSMDLVWNDLGQLLQMTQTYRDGEDSNVHTSTISYDEQGRMLPDNELGMDVRCEYDELGRVVRETYVEDGAGYSNNIHYDAKGRIVEVSSTDHEGGPTKMLFIHNN